ncbi:hypothetical protein ACFPM3_24030 [Streptomyces coeruleoprunus]|uniref:Uncharacterized protein n=1 Tax=Streptomyces coeruleoprunus TaxID=285563 RepID=A0ABV9XIK1_9ACTN
MSGGGEPNIAAPAESLRLLAEGIDKAHGELKELGSIGRATTGRGVSELALTGLQLGHDGLAAQFTSFCERWEWGVRGLMQRGNALAQGIGLAAGGLHEQDQYVKGTIKIVTNAVNGNPHLSEEEVTAKSWDEIRNQRPSDGADWSEESFAEAHAEVKQVWRDTSYDVGNEFAGRLEGAGVYDADERRLMEELSREGLKPTDETIRRVRQQQAGDS